MITAQDAVDDLFRVAATEEKATSTSRLDVLADFCVQELQRRGLKSVEKEASVPGAGRDKRWDVAWRHEAKYRLGLSLIDDLIGEVTNAQLHSQEIVIGYVMVFNVEEDSFSQKHGSTWCDLFRERAATLSGRRPPSWTTGTVEDFVLVEVDFSAGPTILATSQTFDAFFDTLVAQVSARNPNVLPWD